MREKKIKVMKQIEHYEKIILELEQWSEGTKLTSSTFNKVGKVDSIEQKDKMVKLLKDTILSVRIAIPDSNKLYLSEIIKRDNVKFGSNNLILAPVGSGKTTLIKDLIKKDGSKVLMLVSNTTLKNSIAPDNDEIKKNRGDNTYTTQNKNKYGDGDYEVYVMSYAEFGNKIRLNDDFVSEYNQIFCDEIHSLPDYQQYSDSASLAIAMKFLFDKHENKQLYYFTATKENLVNLQKKESESLRNVEVYDYLEHPEIKQYMALSEYKINGVEQIRPHLKARIKSFNYFGYKCLAFNKTIAGQKRIEQIAREEGFKPLVLWSVNNKDVPMNEEQLEAREYLLTHNEIPSPYNFLIINSAMQEGWNLEDDKVKLAIMNTTNETEQIQSLGRLRHDVDILVYRVNKKDSPDLYINLPNKYIDVYLTTEEKNALCNELNLKNSNGRRIMWTTLKGMLKKQGYTIIDTQLIIDGKRPRVSKITI